MAARIRSVHPGLFNDDEFIELSSDSQIFLIGLWTEADDAGIFEWKATQLKRKLRPIKDGPVDHLFDELTRHNFIKQFSVAEKNYGAIRNFCKWQRPRTPVYIFPRDSMEEYIAMTVRDERDGVERGTALGKMLSNQQGHKCIYCTNGITPYRKKSNSLQIDHVTPLSRGGSDDIANLAATCKPCNQTKANMTKEELFAKFAPSELLRNSISQIGDHRSQRENHQSQRETPISHSDTEHSHSENSLSQNKDHPNVAEPLQRKEEGGRRDDEGKDEKGKSGAEAPSRSKQGTRLPDNWTPSEDLLERLLQEGLTLDVYKAQIRSFRNYWHSKPGKDATKLNWDKTFDNWILRNRSQ